MTSSFTDSIYGQRLLSLCNRGQIERIVRESNLEEMQKGLATGDFVVVQENAGIRINVSESADLPEDTLGYVLVRSSDLPHILKKVRRFKWFHASNGKVYLEGKWETKEEESRIWYRQRGRENPMYQHPERYEGLEIIHLRNEAGKIVFSYADRHNSLQKTVKKLWYHWDQDCRKVDSLKLVNEEIAGLDFHHRGKLGLRFENCRVRNVTFSEIKDLSISLVNCQLDSGVSITECRQVYIYLTDSHWYGAVSGNATAWKSMAGVLYLKTTISKKLVCVYLTLEIHISNPVVSLDAALRDFLPGYRSWMLILSCLIVVFLIAHLTGYPTKIYCVQATPWRAVISLNLT